MYIRFIVCLSVTFAFIWIIHVTIEVKPIFHVGNGIRYTILITFSRIIVHFGHLVEIEDVSSSSWEVLCRQWWWQWWYIRQIEFIRRITFDIWSGCYDNLLSIWNVFYGCDYLVLSVRFLLCCTEIVATLPHLQKVMDHGYSVQFSFPCPYLQFQVGFRFHCIQCWVVTCQ